MKRTLAILLLVLGTSSLALADGPNLNQFTPPPGDTSVDFLHEVFGRIVNMVASGADVRTQEADDVLGQMMGVFNTAVLFLGMVFVAYTTVLGTVNSAHDGELLGKKMSEVWVPIRTVGGTALILPLASGYSTLQVGVLWLALQGVGIADAIWSAAINQVSKDSMVANPLIPDARPLAANILRFEVCAAAMNKQYTDTNRSTRIQAVAVPRTTSNTGDLTNFNVLDAIPPVGMYSAIKNYANSRYTVVDYKWRAVDGAGNSDGTYINPDVCGGITWKESWESSEGNANTKVIKAPILAAHASAVRNMITELRPVALQIVAGNKPAPGAIDSATEHYVSALRSAAKQAVQQTNDRARGDFLKTAESSGWIFAGTWYNHIVKMNDVMQSTLNSLPASEPVSIVDGRETREALQNYQDAMAVANEYTKNRVGAVKGVYYKDTDVRAPQDGEGAWEYLRKLISAPFMGAINQMTEEIAGSNLNHMSQMKSLGDTIVVTGEALILTVSAAAGVAGGAPVKLLGTIGSFDFGAALSIFSGVVTFITIGLFIFGVTLSIYAPLIPFITWVTSVVNWFVLVIEAVLAAPIWAAAHIHPDGDDAVGRGGQGYMMILSLIMRPALMVFGLVTAMLLTQPVTGLVNASFMSAVSGVQADSMTGIVSFCGYVTVYVILMTTVLHGVFSLIHWIPDNVPRWIGAHVSGGPVSPDQKEHEGASVFGAAVHKGESGLGRRNPKEERAPNTLSSAPSSGNSSSGSVPSNKDLLG